MAFWCLLFVGVPLILLLLADANREPGGNAELSGSLFTGGMACFGFLALLYLAYLTVLYVYFKRAFGDTFKAVKSLSRVQLVCPAR